MPFFDFLVFQKFHSWFFMLDFHPFAMTEIEDHHHVGSGYFDGHDRSEEKTRHPFDSENRNVRLLTSCSPGYYLSSSPGSICVACPKGSFSFSTTASSCSLAPTGIALHPK